MSKEFICPSCSVPMKFAGGDSIFQTCSACNAPVIVPSEFLYKKEEQLASENFASLVNDVQVDVEQVTNELTPGSEPPKKEDVIDPDARIEKFEVYQEKLGTDSVKTKKAVDKIVTPAKEEKFKTASPFVSNDGGIKLEIPEELKAEKRVTKTNVYEILAGVRTELQKKNKIEAIKIFRSNFRTSLADAKEAVEAIERGDNINVSQYLKQ